MDSDDEQAFSRKPILARTPQSNQKQTPPTSSTNINDKKMYKRGLQKTTLDDLFDLIYENGKKHMDKLDEVKASLKSDMATMKDELNANIDKCQQNIDKKIDLVERKADQGLRVALENRKMCINMMKQARLDCCMDISGLKYTDDRTDLKELALNTIKSFNIKIEEADIKKVTSVAFKKPNTNTNTNTKILTVTFDDIDTKIRVMREKNKIKETKDIYFNITLTPENGYCFRKAKFITKGTTLKPKFYDGAVHVCAGEGIDMIIQNDENLMELKKIVEDMSLVHESNVPEASNSSKQ